MRCTKEWVLKSDIDNQKSLIDRLLEVRGIKSEDAKREFLHPLEITLTHPNAFCDMQKAVERIVKAITLAMAHTTGGIDIDLANKIISNFSKMDTNGDGRVTEAEINAFCIDEDILSKRNEQKDLRRHCALHSE